MKREREMNVCRERGRGFVVRSVGEINVCRERKGRGFVMRSVGEMNVREWKRKRICCEECRRDNVCRERGRGR